MFTYETISKEIFWSLLFVMFPSSDNVTKPYWNKNESDTIFENVMCKYSGNINVSNIELCNSKKNIYIY